MAITTQYTGTTFAPGASCLNTNFVVSIEEGYDVGGTVEYIGVGDYVIDSLTVNGDNRERVTMSMSHVLERSNNHVQPFTVEYKSAYNYKTDFSNVDVFGADFRSVDGCTTGTSGLLVLQNEASQKRFIILDKYTDYKNLSIYTKVRRGSNDVKSRSFEQVFRYGDEYNHMFVRYDNNPGCVITLGDRSWDGATSRETILATVTGVCMNTVSEYYMYTVVNNGKIQHFGSTDSYQFTKHIDLSDIYGSSWDIRIDRFNNAYGYAGIATYGRSAGSFLVGDFRAVSLDNQYSYDEAFRNIAAASNIYGVSIEREFYDMSTLVSPSYAPWGVSTFSIAKDVVASAGASWDTIMTPGITYNNFIVECEVSGTSNLVFGMYFGSSYNWFRGYYSGLGTLNNGLERFVGSRRTTAGVATFVRIQPGTVNTYKMVKQNNSLSWYINNVNVASDYGVTNGDLLNSTGNSSGGIGLFACTGGSAGTGNTILVTNFRISKLDDPVESFTSDGYKSPRQDLDRYLPAGYGINTNCCGINVLEIGLSRTRVSINSRIQSPAADYRYTQGPMIASARGDKYSYNRRSGVSSNYIRTDDSYILSINDSNIRSTADAEKLSDTLLTEYEVNRDRMSVSIQTVPTLQPYDEVYINDMDYTVDGQPGVTISTSTFMVESISKQYSQNGFRETLMLTKGKLGQQNGLILQPL